MEVTCNTNAAPIAHEEELLQSFQRLSKRTSGKVVERIAIEDAHGDVRLAIDAYTDSECDGIDQLLRDRHFDNGVDIQHPFGEESNNPSYQLEITVFEREGFDNVYRFIGTKT
ncbi:MAG: hypothetical protein ABI671_08485 [Burkholderiales bacterium]